MKEEVVLSIPELCVIVLSTGPGQSKNWNALFGKNNVPDISLFPFRTCSKIPR